MGKSERHRKKVAGSGFNRQYNNRYFYTKNFKNIRMVTRQDLDHSAIIVEETQYLDFDVTKDSVNPRGNNCKRGSV